MQYSKDQGGAAVPNPKLYFYASELQHLGGCGLPNDSDLIRNLLQSGTIATLILAGLEAGLPESAPTIILWRKLWAVVKNSL